ncbi:hypothetical protein [Massilia sp. S19_KUP03_FR1]|uniref:hypothetical protein n=1 Tax=Massilia sp. S19_KUP03_FR1 TaxID=3025503 RepID=UPI002FCDBB44
MPSYQHTSTALGIARAGMHNIEQMQRLAEQGKGLSANITRHVHDAYARKWEPRNDT